MSDPADTPTPAPQPARSDPQAFQLRGPTPRVMRLSRKTLALGGVVAGLGIGGSLFYALHPSAKQPVQELYSTDNKARAETITSGPKDYSQTPKLGAPLPGDLGRPILSAQERGGAVPVPPVGTAPGQPDPRAQAAEAARQRVAQERDAARTASVFLGNGSQSSTAPAAATPMPAPVVAAGDTTSAPVAGGLQGDQSSKRAFMAQASNPRTVSIERLAPPVSPNIVQAGSIIPAALITGLRSDLPGQITAQVTQNVYDSPTGRILLIPQGTRLIGEYDSQVAAGQTRVLLAWDRLILPDGRSIVLERQSGADAAGYAGLQDKVDQHWGGVLKAAMISTPLGIGTELGSGNDSDLVRALRRGTQDTINQAGQQIVQRQLAIQPTLTIRPGYPLRVIVTTDLILEPIGATR